MNVYMNMNMNMNIDIIDVNYFNKVCSKISSNIIDVGYIIKKLLNYDKIKIVGDTKSNLFDTKNKITDILNHLNGYIDENNIKELPKYSSLNLDTYYIYSSYNIENTPDLYISNIKERMDIIYLSFKVVFSLFEIIKNTDKEILKKLGYNLQETYNLIYDMRNIFLLVMTSLKIFINKLVSKHRHRRNNTSPNISDKEDINVRTRSNTDPDTRKVQISKRKKKYRSDTKRINTHTITHTNTNKRFSESSKYR